MDTVHVHYFQGATSEVFGHQHRYYGKSNGAPNLVGHCHQISGCTTKDENHRHYHSIATGPSIDIPGGHIHSYQGFTTVDQEHRHYICGNTLANDNVPIVRTSFTTQEARKIGETLGINWEKSQFNVEQFRTGLDVELEHGRRDQSTDVTDDDPFTTGKIALAHLKEFPDYYIRLKKLENAAKAFWQK